MIGYLVSLFLSISLIFIGVEHFIKYFIIKNKHIKCTATVIEVKNKLDDEYFIKYPIIEYKVLNEIISLQLNLGMSIFQWKVGDQINIFYNPRDIKTIFINEMKAKILYGLMIIVGFIFLIVNIYF